MMQHLMKNGLRTLIYYLRALRITLRFLTAVYSAKKSGPRLWNWHRDKSVVLPGLIRTGFLTPRPE